MQIGFLAVGVGTTPEVILDELKSDALPFRDRIWTSAAAVEVCLVVSARHLTTVALGRGPRLEPLSLLSTAQWLPSDRALPRPSEAS